MSHSPENANDIASILAMKRNSRKSHRKSRNGCDDCKRRRIKCDEQRPACSNCLKHSTPCSFMQHVPPVPNQSSLRPSLQLAQLLNQPVSPPQSSGPASFSEASESISTTLTTPAAASLTVPAILSDRHSNPTINMPELELQHNYDTATSYTMATTPALQTFLRVNVPRMAFSHPFLAHGILGVSALHLAHFKRDLKNHYFNLAQYHCQTGLHIATPLFSVMNEKSCSALYLFSTFATLFVFGMGPKSGDFLLFGDRGPAEGQALFRGTRTLIESNPSVFGKSDLSPLVSISIRQMLHLPSNNQHLNSLRQYIMESTANPADAEVYLEALESLSRSFPPDSTSGSRASQTSLHTVFIWLYRLSDDFLRCLQKRDPIALLIFAHFCVLLNDMGSLWFMTGWVNHLLSEIHRSLDGEHRMWMNWPMEEVGWIPSS